MSDNLDMRSPGVWNRIVTSVYQNGPFDYRVVLRYENTETGTSHTEMSTRQWHDEEGARKAAEILAPIMQERIINGGTQ